MSVDTQPDQDASLSFEDHEVIDPAEPRKPFWARYSTILILAIIFILAAFFRFYDRDFDQGTSQHPDEIAIVGHTLQVQWPSSVQQLLTPTSSPLNLRVTDRYPWGALPVYVARGSAWVANQFVSIFKPELKNYYLNDYHGAQLVGRTMASIFDLITILLVFLITRRLYSTRTALIATALVAFSVTNIQIAHFYITEPFLVTFMMASLYFAVILMQNPSWWAAVGAGAFLGFSVASKVSSALIFVMIIVALLLRAAYRKHTRKLGADLDDPVGMRPATARERDRSFMSHAVRGLRYFIIAAVIGVLAFAITEPYALWQFDFSHFSSLPGEPQNIGQNVKNLMLSNPWGRGIVDEAGTQSGTNDADVPYTRQYVGTVPVLFHFEQLVFWGVGVIPGLIIIAGLLLALWLAIKRRPAELILLSFALPYFATILIAETKWMRYMLPLVPVFCILGAALLVRGAKWAAERWPQRAHERGFTIRAVQRNFFPILTASAILFAFLWSCAYVNVYSQDHTRVQAARWVNANVPAGSKVSNETWDAGLPNMTGVNTGQGSDFGFALYDDHPADEELNYVQGMMNKVDYIILASNRLYGSISRMPWRYPVQIKFYQLLFAGKLGYQLVHTEQVVPSLLGIQWNDQLADESFTVYDHPRVDIFKKVTTPTTAQLRTLFSTALNVPPGEYSTLRHDTITDDKSLIYDQPLSYQPDVGNYAWNPLAQNDTQWGAVLFWLLAVYLISFAAMPVVFTVFKRLPDKGYAFAKLTGLGIVTYGVWLLASGHVLPFTTWSVLLLLLALAAFAVVLWRMGAGVDIRDFVKKKRNLIIYCEVLFLAAFAFMLFIRILNPDVWHTVYGGEKTMEVGFLNGALRSPWMPPADPFFAGGYTNYYYQGQFIIACLIKLIGVDPAIAYNLSFPLLFGLCFTTAASIVYNIVAWSRSRRGSLHLVSRLGMAFGVVAGVLYLFIGNMHSLFEWVLITFPRSAGTLLLWGKNLGMIGPSWTNPYTQFNFWDPSRIINGTINEFPYWTFIYGDLHPHLIDMPFTLLAVALALNLAFAGRFVSLGSKTGSWFQTTRNSVRATLNWLWGTGGAGLLAFTVTALVLGDLFVTNSWDFPTFAGLTGGAVLIAVLLSRRVPTVIPMGEAVGAEPADMTEAADPAIGARGGLILSVTAFVSVGMVAGLALLAYFPFFLTFKAFFTKLMFITDGGTIPGTTAVMHRTTIWEFLVVWGIFVFIAVTYLLVRLWNFPWRDAIVDLFGIVLAGGQKVQQPALSSPAVISYEPAASQPRGLRKPLRRQATLRLSPAFSGADSPGWLAAFAGSSPDDDPATSATVDTSDYASSPSANGQDAEYPGDPDANYSQPEGQTANGYVLEPDTPAYETVHNWVADAHTEVERERQVVVRNIDSQQGVIPLWLGFAILAATAAMTILQIATGQPLVALLIALIGGISGTLLSTTRSVAALTGGLLLVVALLVTLGVEIVYLSDHLAGGDSYRMNTVFKFYTQAWGLFAVGGAVSIYYTLFGLRDAIEKKRTRTVVQPTTPPASTQPNLAEGIPSADGNTVPVAYPNEASTSSSVDVDRAITTPLQQHTSNNWLVWSTNEIEDASNRPQILPSLANPDTKPLEARPTLPTLSEPPIEQLETRRLRRATLPPGVTYMPPAPQQRVEEAESGVTVETYDPPPTTYDLRTTTPLPADLLRFKWSVGKVVWAVIFVFFLFVGFLYPLYGTPSKVKERINPNAPLGTLNGLSYMENATFSPQIDDKTSVFVQMKYDLEGINWLNQHVTGLHTIAELPLEYYRAGGMRVASNTGLPMVIGDLHQEEQRADVYARLVGDRRGDMNTFFTTPDVQVALTLISKYDIDYIYMGQVEQARAGDSGVKKFEQMADPKVGILTEVFRSDNPAGVPGTIIYEVNHGDKDPKGLVGAPVEGSGIPGISITPLPTSTPIPPPTPPVDDPVLKGLIVNVTANPRDRDSRQELVTWYRDHNFPTEAAEQLEILVQQNPTDVPIRSQLGDMYQSTGQLDKALKAWEDARDVAPNNPDAHNKLGLAYVDRKRFDDAITEFQAAVTNSPTFVESWFHMGEVYELKGDKPNALKAYQSAMDNSQNDNNWKSAAQARINQLK